MLMLALGVSVAAAAMAVQLENNLDVRLELRMTLWEVLGSSAAGESVECFDGDSGCLAAVG